MQGTCCDALFVQAVEGCENVEIHTIESHENLARETLIEPHYLAQHPSTTIYLGHFDELHYVSTATVICGSDALENQHSTYLRSTEQDVLFKQPQNSSSKRKRDAYRKKGLILFPDLLWTKPKARFGQMQFASRNHLSGI